MPQIALFRNMATGIVCLAVLAAACDLRGATPDVPGAARATLPELVPAGNPMAAPVIAQPVSDAFSYDTDVQRLPGVSHAPAAAATPCHPQQSPATVPVAPGPKPGPLRALACRCAEDCSEVPFAAPVFAAARTQIRNGVAARLVLYQYDFCDDDGPAGDNLNPYGLARLGKLIRMIPAADCHPIVIQCTQNPRLDAARRARVLEVLCRMNIPDPEQLVVVGAPQAPELRGLEAMTISSNLTMLIENQKVSDFAPAAGGSSSSSTTSSSSSATSVSSR